MIHAAIECGSINVMVKIAMKRMITVLMLIALLVWNPQVQAQEQNPKTNLRTSGTITGMRNGVIQVKTTDGDMWLVAMPDNATSLEIAGSALPNWIRRGMFVRFSGYYTAKGKPQGEIRELWLFSPDESTQFGVSKEADFGQKKLFADGENKEKPKAEPAAKFLVSGRVASLKDNKLSVQAGNYPVQAVISAKPVIHVKTNDWRMMSLGDKVEVEAWYYTQAVKLRQAKATRLKVTPSKPFGTPPPEKEDGESKDKKQDENKDDVEKPADKEE